VSRGIAFTTVTPHARPQSRNTKTEGCGNCNNYILEYRCRRIDVAVDCFDNVLVTNAYTL